MFKFLVSSSSPKEFSQLVIFLGIHIILDLTPNYQGQNAWFLPAQADIVATKMKVRFYGRQHTDVGAVWIYSQQASCALCGSPKQEYLFP